jgi:hypothetical protein
LNSPCYLTAWKSNGSRSIASVGPSQDIEKGSREACHHGPNDRPLGKLDADKLKMYSTKKPFHLHQAFNL